jgi:hypothetical protein
MTIQGFWAKLQARVRMNPGLKTAWFHARQTERKRASETRGRHMRTFSRSSWGKVFESAVTYNPVGHDVCVMAELLKSIRGVVEEHEQEAGGGQAARGEGGGDAGERRGLGGGGHEKWVLFSLSVYSQCC